MLPCLLYPSENDQGSGPRFRSTWPGSRTPPRNGCGRVGDGSSFSTITLSWRWATWQAVLGGKEDFSGLDLVNRTASSLAKEFDAFAKSTATLAERRNRVVHDPWFFFPHLGSAARLEITARRKLREELVHVEIAEITRLAADIQAHLVNFGHLHDRAQAVIAAARTQ